jgi:hypothetical protein
MKRCSKCQEWKERTEFWVNRRNPDGLGYMCKVCNAAKDKAWRAANADYIRAKTKQWQAANPGKVAASQRKTKYGLTPEGHEALRASQGGVCAACGNAAKLVVDHNHETGAVRGLLCQSCNSALGFAKDCPERLLALIEYLNNSNLAKLGGVSSGV